MVQIRWHGRGGQGAVTAARIFGLAAAVYGGRYAQSFPSFGTERRGAPVTAFTRLDDRPLRDRSQIYNPDYVVVLDATLLESIDVFAGLAGEGSAIINSSCELASDKIPAGVRVHYLDATSLARDILGRPIVNTAMVAALAGVSGLVPLKAVTQAIADVLPVELVHKNTEVARLAYAKVRETGANIGEAVPPSCLRLPVYGGLPVLKEDVLRKGPNLVTPFLSTTTASWRVERPVLDAGRCNNCLACWLYCPEGCFTRGEDRVYLHLDFCKGCGICVAECPRRALILVKEGGDDARLSER